MLPVHECSTHRVPALCCLFLIRPALHVRMHACGGWDAGDSKRDRGAAPAPRAAAMRCAHALGPQPRAAAGGWRGRGGAHAGAMDPWVASMLPHRLGVPSRAVFTLHDTPTYVFGRCVATTYAGVGGLLSVALRTDPPLPPPLHAQLLACLPAGGGLLCFHPPHHHSDGGPGRHPRPPRPQRQGRRQLWPPGALGDAHGRRGGQVSLAHVRHVLHFCTAQAQHSP